MLLLFCLTVITIIISSMIIIIAIIIITIYSYRYKFIVILIIVLISYVFEINYLSIYLSIYLQWDNKTLAGDDNTDYDDINMIKHSPYFTKSDFCKLHSSNCSLV